MKHLSYDIAVIGAGAGGLTASIGLAKAGKNVVLIEKGAMGGDCTNFGCVPSKALIHYANTQPTIGVQEALKHVRAKREHFLDHESPAVMKEKHNIDVIKGKASFQDKQTLLIDDHTLVSFKKAIIATGSHPRMIHLPGMPEDKVITNEEIFEITGPLDNLIIVGGGYIACELGEAFARLGAAVTMLVRGSSLINSEEPEVSSVIENILVDAGVKIMFNTVATGGNENNVIIETKGQESSLPVDYLLLSIGRVSNTKSLSLEKTDIVVENNGIEVDQYNRTKNKNIFAVGDCVADNPKFTHRADHEARGVVRNILIPFWKKSVRGQSNPMTMYTSTEVARVGMTYAELVDHGMDDNTKTITIPFADDDRSYLNDEQQGFVTIHFSRLRGKILGATVVAPKAGTMLAQITQAKDNNISAYKLMNMVHAYPTKARTIKKAAQEFVLYTLHNRTQEIKYRLHKNMFKIFALVLRSAVIFAYFWYKNSYGLTNGDVAFQIYHFISGTIWGPVIYMTFYAFRSIVLFPASITTLLSGMLFGPIRGIVYTFIGENMGANIAYWIGQKLGKGMINPTNSGLMSTIKKRLTGNDYLSVLLLRLIPINFDLVNYGCGIFGVKWKPYFIATAFGIIPGMVTYILAGASINIEEGFSFESFSLNSTYLTIAAALYVVSFGIAFILKKKFKDQL